MNKKVVEKEKSIKELIDGIKFTLNNQSRVYKGNSNDWTYLTSLSFTETKLKEISDFIDEVNNISKVKS
jgi:hypothetical protein